MSSDPAALNPAEPSNPYAAPEAALAPSSADLGPEVADAEAIRRQYLSHEASVKSVGSLYLLGGIVWAMAAAVPLWMRIEGMTGSGSGNSPDTAEISFLLLSSASSALNFAVGISLLRLKPWARWMAIVFGGLGLTFALLAGIASALFGNLVGGLILILVVGGITSYILYVLLSRKAAVVFSAEYRAIIARTPHVRYQTRMLVTILLVLLLVIFLPGVINIVASLIG